MFRMKSPVHGNSYGEPADFIVSSSIERRSISNRRTEMIPATEGLESVAAVLEQRDFLRRNPDCFSILPHDDRETRPLVDTESLLGALHAKQ